LLLVLFDREIQRAEDAFYYLLIAASRRASRGRVVDRGFLLSLDCCAAKLSCSAVCG
jgi:hypothetical protein